MTMAAMAKPLPFSPRSRIWERAMMPRISGTSGTPQTTDMTNATMASVLVFCDIGGGAYQPCWPPYGPGCPGCPYGPDWG